MLTGDVLDFQYPGIFGDVIKALRPIMDLWGLLFRALGPSECFGLKGFTARWLLRIVGLPGVIATICLCYYCWDRRSSGPAKAGTNLKSHAFFGVFFCYPTICIVSFATFICRQIGPGVSVLDADDNVFCQDSSHKTLQALSGFVVAFVAVGLPILFGYILIKAAHDYQRDSAQPNKEMALRMSTELGVDVTTAEYVIRDVTIGRSYSFLMDAYVPQYLYWEALDMLRKLALVGLVLCVGRGSVAQLSAAIILSFAFFALQMYTWPYKITQDNVLRAATECHVFIVITTALVLKNDLSWEIIGIDVYDMILFLSFIVLVPGAAVVAVISKLRYVQKVLNRQDSTDDENGQRRLSFDLQALGLATDADRVDLKRYVDGWFVRGKYAAFLSHFKNEAAAEARVLKLELVRTLRAKEEQVFLDSDNLTDLRELLDCVRASDALILMYTHGVLSRPWCLLELHAAVQASVPIVVMRIQNQFAGETSEISSILGDLPNYLEKENPRAEETLRAFGMDAATIGKDIMAGLKHRMSPERRRLAADEKSEMAEHASLEGRLREYERRLDRVAELATEPEDTGDPQDEAISFDPHQSSVILQHQINQVAALLVAKACPENESLLSDMKPPEAEPWPVHLQYAVYIIHEEQTPLIIEQAQAIKTWLVESTDLDESQVVLHMDAPDTRNRAINDASLADIESLVKETDCVLLLQTSKVMYEPRCLAKLYAVCRDRLPIVPVVLMKSKHEHDALMYDFATVKPMMEDLSAHLEPAVVRSVEAATGTTVTAVGLALSLLIPNIISKPLGLQVAAGERNAQMAEIERTLRRSTSSGQTPRTIVGARQLNTLSNQRVVQLHTAFARIDADGDGGITREEIMHAVRRDPEVGELLGLDGHTGDKQAFEAGRVFQSMDTDGDESIDVHEFVSYFGSEQDFKLTPDDVEIVPMPAQDEERP